MNHEHKIEDDEDDFSDHEETIHDARERDQIILEQSVFETDNRLDSSMQHIIDKLHSEKSAFEKKIEAIKKADDSVTKKSTLSEEAYEDVVTNLQLDLMDTEVDLMYNEEELVAVSEVRIMYAMKHLEINIKRLIKTAFAVTNTRTLFKWETLVDFLKAKEIDIKKVICYKEVDQLRQVNNWVKHAADADKSIQHIDEFKGMDYPSSDALQKFYLRVQPGPDQFIKSLMLEIYTHLYRFDNERLEKMAEDLALRMDPKSAKTFAKKLTRHYKK